MSKTNSKHSELKNKIAEKEAELRSLKEELNNSMSLYKKEKDVVKAPNELLELFRKSQQNFKSNFSDITFEPEKGSIHINGERYILIRSESMSYDFFHSLLRLYKNKSKDEAYRLASDLLFDIAHIIGREDAHRFHKKMNVKTPFEKLAAGPVHFAYTGWANVEILPESNPASDESFFLKYRHHSSFESEAWISNNQSIDQSVCIMNAGYSSGWCEASFGFPLTAVEITCQALGDDFCEFIMAPPHKIQEHLDKEMKKHPKHAYPTIPSFFERQDMQQQLSDNEKMLRDAQRISKMGGWELYFENNTLHFSDEVYTIFNIKKTKNENLFDKYIHLFNEEGRKEVFRLIEQAKETGKGYDLKHTVNLANGIKKWLLYTAVPIKNTTGKTIGLQGIVQDITARIVNERELDNFFKISVDLQCIASKEGYFLKLSPSWEKLLGYTIEELTSQPYINFIHPDDKKTTKNKIQYLKQNKSVLSFENRYIKKNGEEVVLSWNSRTDSITGLVYATARDITEQRKAKNKLISNLSTKEVLLREIHHRVKNNLQVISSLLSLQANFETENNKRLKKLYSDSQNRIKSMAAIHELFYKSESLDLININTYINKLLNDLVHSFKGDKNKLKLNLKIADIYLNLDTVIPLGLIINEILTNALKHGFSTNGKGEITIKMIAKKDNTIQLNIGDDGVGYYNALAQKDKETLGITIITSLIEQLNGTIEQDNSKKGTHYRLTFREQ